jgi:hypothetical protein
MDYAVIATGPSLVQEDVDAVRGLKVIAVSNAFRMAPWADVLYSADARWWQANPHALGFPGLRLSFEATAGVTCVRNGAELIGPRPSNSGYHAIKLAHRFGAKRILLLGFDCKSDGRKTHYFGQHQKWERAHPYAAWRENFKTIGHLPVINCTPGSALECFPKMELCDALQVLRRAPQEVEGVA